MSEEKAICSNPECGNDDVSGNVKKYSLDNYGVILCYPCQELVRSGKLDVEALKETLKKKGTLEGYASEGGKELEEFDEKLDVEEEEDDREVVTELEAEEKELDAKDKTGEEKVIEAEVVDDGEESKWRRTVEIDEGTFAFCEEDEKLLCKSGDNVYEIHVSVPDCTCPGFPKNKEKNKWCKHLKAASQLYLVKEFPKEIGEGITPKSIRGDQIEKITKLQDEVRGNVSMEKVLGYIKKNYGAEHIENLTEGQGDGVISQLRHINEVKEEQEKQVKTKEIDIEWNKIPLHVLLPKLKKALEYELVGEWSGGFISVKKREKGGKTNLHLTSHNSCDCGDWINRGTSLNPCLHQVRVKYDDGGIIQKLREAQPMENNAAQPSTAQPSVFSGISQLQPRLCETGKIKIGELSDKRTGSGRRLPKKLDHFVITTLLRDEEGTLLLDEEMAKKVGDDCKELDIYLCYDSPELNMPTFYAYFTQSKLRCMGDGKTALKTKDDGGKEEITCNPKMCDAYKKKLCKPYGRLSVILSQANRIGGAYVFRTTSWNTLRNILTSMSFIRTITGGILAGLPLKMRLIPMQVQPKDLGHTVRIYMVNIEFDGDMKLLMEAADQEVKRRLQMGTSMKQIEADSRREIAERVREEAEEQAAEIAKEFVPGEEN